MITKPDFPFFVKADDVPGVPSLFGATCVGNTLGKSGSGTLAIIVFGYRVENYETPTVQEDHPKTSLHHAPGSNPLNISLEGQTELLLQTVG